MTNSSDCPDAAVLVATLLALTSEEHLYESIEWPLERAAQQFSLEVPTPITREVLHDAITSFVAHLYQHGLRFPRRMTPAQARTEAIYLLTSASPDGYDETVLGVADGQKEALEAALAQLLHIVTESEKHKYVAWAFASRINPLDWECKCRLARYLLDQCAQDLPERLRRCTPAQLADHVLDLFSLHAGSENFIKQIITRLANSQRT